MSDRFLREIHHFLWTEASVTDIFDPGWSCRDHAWVVALLVQSFGHSPLFVHGEAFIATGPTAKSAGCHVLQKPHSWVVVPGIGMIDLSIKPAFSGSDVYKRFPVKCIYADEWIPRGRNKVHMAGHPNEFARVAEDLARHRNQSSAVYLTNEVEHVHRGHLTYAAGWIRSPLAKQLDALYGSNPSDLYAALLMHLRGFLEDSVPSLADLPKDQAWSRLAEARNGAIAWAKMRLEFSMPPAPRDSPWIMGEAAQPI